MLPAESADPMRTGVAAADEFPGVAEGCGRGRGRGRAWDRTAVVTTGSTGGAAIAEGHHFSCSYSLGEG